MKKILAIAIVAIMTVALCVSASALFNVDRIFVNVDERIDGAEAPDVKSADPIEIKSGDKLFILGWAANTESPLKEVVWSIDGGADQKCSNAYRDRPDLASANVQSYENGKHAGIGYDTKADDHEGMLELTGVDKLKDGTYKLTVKAIYEDGTSEAKDYNLKVGTGVKAEEPENPGTADAAVIAIAAVACVALAGVVVAKKVK